MTPVDLKIALRLYKQYKVTGREYYEIANRCGMNTGELNQECNRVLAIRKIQASNNKR